jgi:tetratricopeptide (TPR) repeat protein
VVGTARAEAAAGKSEVQTLLASGRQALGAGKWTEAAALFEKAQRMDPANDDAAFGLSAVYIELDRLPEALPLLERLIKIAPENPMVRNNLAWVYVKIKDPAVRNPGKAVRLARAAVLDMPSDYSIWNTLAEAYLADGRYDRALRAAESALRLSRLAGVTNTVPSLDLVSRCRKAAGRAGAAGTGDEQP